ncbi:oleate hydratase [Bermanella marisrubri]|uniref:Monoamine oxidase family protein, membrane associated n=1 Tax=Bermanella marisrubri TaxID=207949 RepID=Q1N5W4_9GAMM|nr:oleate hydratase [Bermanella marisrubri]EAT13828.1 Monoamine oxidase family protein, membrane associated [Oceanobacter sp. RED65] [Bermanella marisrubri]QIZ84592.1 oleate hydratase [Bermanella marisrubri]
MTKQSLKRSDLHRKFVEKDATAEFWHNSPSNTLPPPDMLSPYSRNKPLKTEDIENRKAHIIGAGIAGLAAAFYLIRDGHMPAENIFIFTSEDVEGGSLDGAGNVQEGYIVRGGREMNWNYDNLWDMFQDVPAVELPTGFSVLDEYRLLNDHDSNYSKARLLHKNGQIKDFSNFGLSKRHQWELISLLLKRKEELDDITVESYFSSSFLETNFWTFWRTMFAFQNWHSVLEMKLYMHRFLDAIDGLNDMSALVFPKYNQYETFVEPLTKMLKEQGVNFIRNQRICDLEIQDNTDAKTITGLITATGEVLAVDECDLVFALTGSMTEGTAYGDMDTVPELQRTQGYPGTNSDWVLWKNLAEKSTVFGNPNTFVGDTSRSMWESATLTCHHSPLVDKLISLSVNDPFSGKTATGGICTITDSNWLMSCTINRQPHFRNQPDDVLVVWVYALLMDKQGNKVHKTMPECTGKEILEELCHHLGLEDQFELIAENTKVRTALMPYITAEFMPRAKGDRPRIVPEGFTNLGLVGQFVETNNDVVFTMESSVRTARVAVYSLLNLSKVVPDISPTQYDVRNMLKGARALNNGKPFIGERLLHRLLDKTYYAHILPPLPEPEESKLESLEAEIKQLPAKLSVMYRSVSDQVHRLRDKIINKK